MQIELIRTLVVRILLVAFVTLSFNFSASCQVADLAVTEAELVVDLKSIVTESSYSRRDSLNGVFLKKFESALKAEGAFGYPFDSLKNIGRLKSDDGLVRIFTWNIPQVGGYQKYYGFIQAIGEDKTTRLFRLNDNRKSNEDVFNLQLNVDTWQGALYYQIVTVENRGSSYYVLLGYDYNDLFTSKKVIDVLSFSRTGQPIFGLNVFDVDGKQQLSRIVFEFAARASMTLRYEEKSKTIVFDHLSPSEPKYAGNLQYYGPDFSYDGFKLDSKKWVYVRDLDMRNAAKPRSKSKSKEKPEEPIFMYKPNYKK